MSSTFLYYELRPEVGATQFEPKWMKAQPLAKVCRVEEAQAACAIASPRQYSARTKRLCREL